MKRDVASGPKKGVAGLRIGIEPEPRNVVDNLDHSSQGTASAGGGSGSRDGVNNPLRTSPSDNSFPDDEAADSPTSAAAIGAEALATNRTPSHSVEHAAAGRNASFSSGQQRVDQGEVDEDVGRDGSRLSNNQSLRLAHHQQSPRSAHNQQSPRLAHNQQSPRMARHLQPLPPRRLLNINQSEATEASRVGAEELEMQPPLLPSPPPLVVRPQQAPPESRRRSGDSDVTEVAEALSDLVVEDSTSSS